MKKKVYLLTCFAVAALAMQSCKKQDATLIPAGVVSAGLVDSPHVSVSAHLKQHFINVPNAKFKLSYNWNGSAQLDSALTDTSGNASFLMPLNTVANLKITSHCGVLLYERKFGPFTTAGAIDSTFRVLAYSPTCDSVAPDQYFTYRMNGVEHRFTSPADSFDRRGYAWYGAQQYVMKRDGSGDMAILEWDGNTPNIGMSVTVSPAWLTSWNYSVSYTERGSVNGYSAGSFILDLSHVEPAELDPDTEFKIPCTFRFKLTALPNEPEW